MRRRNVPCSPPDCGCSNPCGNKVRTINAIPPDVNGNFIIQAGTGVSINTILDGIRINASVPQSMTFCGTVGTGGTVATLPDADPDNIGNTYIAVSPDTTPVSYQTGDMLISNGTTWVVVPSGDEIIPIVTAWQTTPDDAHIPSEKLVKDSINQCLQTGGFEPNYCTFYYADGNGNKTGPWISISKINGDNIAFETLGTYNVNLAKPDLSNVSIDVSNADKYLKVASDGSITYGGIPEALANQSAFNTALANDPIGTRYIADMIYINNVLDDYLYRLTAVDLTLVDKTGGVYTFTGSGNLMIDKDTGTFVNVQFKSATYTPANGFVFKYYETGSTETTSPNCLSPQFTNLYRV